MLVHVGFALSKIDEEQARETIALLERIGEPYEQELRRAAPERAMSEERCLTCSDALDEGLVIALDESAALVSFGERLERIAVELVAPLEVGERVLCHGGVALQKVEP